MTIENNETIIDSTTNETTSETETTEEVVEEATEAQQEEKPVEPDDAKRARLKRQLAQVEKRLGIKEESKETKVVETKSTDLSQKDLIALLKADVTESDDIDEVTDYARLKKISVADALKTPLVTALIREKMEQRKTAQATNVGTTKRGSSKPSEETLLSKAKQGELPDSDEDLTRLVRARKGLK